MRFYQSANAKEYNNPVIVFFAIVFRGVIFVTLLAGMLLLYFHLTHHGKGWNYKEPPAKVEPPPEY